MTLRIAGSMPGYVLRKRSTGSTKTVAPPTRTSMGSRGRQRQGTASPATAGWHSSTKKRELMRPFPTRPIGLLPPLCLPADLTNVVDGLLDRLNSFGNFDVFLYIQHVYFSPRLPTAPFRRKWPLLRSMA